MNHENSEIEKSFTREVFRGKLPLPGNQIIPSIEKSGTKLFMASDFDPFRGGFSFHIDESQTG